MLNFTSSLLWNQNFQHPEDIKKVVIFRPGSIGDIICSIPAMIAVRETFKNAHITLITSPGDNKAVGATKILKGAWFVDEIYEYTKDDVSSLRKKYKFFIELRKRKIDLWINLPLSKSTFKRTFRDMLVVKLAGIKKAIGFEIGIPASPFLKQYLKLPLPNEVERLLKILEKYQIRASKVRFDLPITDKVIKRCNDIIEKLNIPQDKPWVAIAPFTKQIATQWPLEGFLKVASYLREKGFILLILGGKSDREEAEKIIKKIGSNSFNLCGKLSVIESAYVLSRCKFLVTNDSGPMHLAAAVGTRCVAIFSGMDYEGQWHPYEDIPGFHIIIRYKGILKCSPCYTSNCKFPNSSRFFKMCILSIRPEEVIGELDKLLSQEKRILEGA